MQADPAQRAQQHIGHRLGPQPQLVGPHRGGRGAIRIEVELALLDPVLHLAADAVDPLVKVLGLALVASERGDDEARIGLALRPLGLGDDPTAAAPSSTRPPHEGLEVVNTAEQDQGLVAAFQQNSLQRVAAGDQAEVAFDAVPGRVFQAKVRNVIDAIATGQLGTTSSLVEAETRTTEGRALAVIDVTDDMSGYNIPVGSTAQVAIYTHHWHHVALIRKILLRMRSWQNYVVLEGH